MIDFAIGQTLPDFLLADRNGYALAKAVESALKSMCATVQAGVDAVQDVDKMPEWRLDELAWEYGAEWYDYDATLEIKRSQIKGVQDFFNRLGTPYAVESALSAVYGDGTIKEWFEYGGDPFHFKAYTTNASALTENRKKFIALLDVVKNVRSVLDGIVYYGSGGKATYYAATAALGVSGCSRGTAK